MSTKELSFGGVCDRLGFIGKALRLGQPTGPFKNGFDHHSQAIHTAICSQTGLDVEVYTWKRLLRAVPRDLKAQSQVSAAYGEFVAWLVGFGESLSSEIGIEREILDSADWIVTP